MKRYKNNKGFSLVEMIIVLAIMAVLTAVAGIGLSYLSSTSKNQAANNVAAYIGKAQTYAMSKKGVYGVQFKSNNGNCEVSIVEQDGTNWKSVSDAYTVTASVPMSIYVATGSGTSKVAATGNGSTSAYVITFERSSGGMNGLYNGGTVVNGTVPKITFGDTRVINIIWRTGKYSVSAM